MGISIITGNSREFKEKCGLYDLILTNQKLVNLNASNLASTAKSKMMESLSVNSTKKSKLIDKLLADTNYPVTIESIFKDLGRTFFFPSNNKKFADLIAAWTHGLRYTGYAQGDMDGRPHTILHEYILNNPRFYEEHPNCSEKNKDHEMFFQNIQNVSFAYFDDNGSPCGACISYSPNDPSLWTVTIVRHTTSGNEEKIITLFAPEQLIYRHKNKHEKLPNDSKDKNKELLTASLNSIELSEKLSGLIQEDGCIDIHIFKQISQHLIHLGETIIPARVGFTIIYNAFCDEVRKNLGTPLDKHPIAVVNKYFKNFLISSITKADTVDKVNNLSTWLINFTNLEYKQLIYKTPKIQDAFLSQLAKQSFTERNEMNIIWGMIGLITFVSLLCCTLTPLGLILGVNLIVSLLIGVAIFAFTLTIANVITIIIREHQLTYYNEQTLKNSQIDNDYKQTTNQIDTLIVNKINLLSPLNTEPAETHDVMQNTPPVHLECSSKPSNFGLFAKSDKLNGTPDNEEIENQQIIEFI